jgi:uridine phosphorylase
VAHRFAWVLAVAGVFAVGASRSYAHHAFTAQYDPDKTASLSGVVVKIEWLNPHAYFFIDVTDEATGEIATWACELTSPVGLMRQGWTRNSMTIGDVVVVEGALARDGSASLNAQSVVLTSTGQRLFGRTAAEERQTRETAR